MRIRPDSTEYATATVTADHDITGKGIEVALPVSGEAPATWTAADVLSVVQSLPGRWTATYRVLVGPVGGAFTLEAPKHYDWTVRITDTPEVPVFRAGHIHVTN